MNDADLPCITNVCFCRLEKNSDIRAAEADRKTIRSRLLNIAITLSIFLSVPIFQVTVQVMFTTNIITLHVHLSGRRMLSSEETH